jgi:Ricin-type beta-trefoil lectin domain
VTAPSADRAPQRGNWFARWFARLPWPGKAKPRSEPPPRADHGLWTVDRAVRVLTTSCDREQRGAPVAHAVVVRADTVAFHLGTPDEPAPAGWTTTNDGRTWQAQLRWLQGANVAEALPDPYPQLVSLGAGGEGFVLLNLSQAGGVIGLEGDARQARALARDWARDLATSPWSRDVQVVRVGFRDDPAGPAAATDVATFRDAEAALAGEAGGVLILAGMPGGRDRERVHALAEDPAGRWSVVVVGRVDNPRWRFTVDAAGLVDTGLFSGPVAHRPDMAGSVAARTAPAVPTGEPAGTPQTRPLYTRPRFIAATVALALLLGTGLTLALVDFSPPRTPAADSAVNQTTSEDPVPPAQGAPGGSERRQLVNPATGKCLTAVAGSDGTPLTLQPCTNAPNQRWVVTEDGTIRTKGLCMDSAWGATTPGTVVQIANCSGNPAQQFSRRGDTLYARQANLCATAVDGGAGIQLQACGNSEAQIFKRG